MEAGPLRLKPAMESQQVTLNSIQQAGELFLAQHEKQELLRVVKS